MKKLYAIFGLALFTVACQSEEKPDPKSSSKELLTFTFKQSSNPSIGGDVTGIISGNEVKVSISPAATLNNLKATFTSSALSTITVNGTTQESGTTSNDFTNPVVYKVTAQDGSSNNYTVSVTKALASDKQLTSFAVSFKSFSGKDIVSQAKISGNTFTIFLPPHINIKAVKPTFSSSPQAQVSHKNVVQVSGESTVDLSASATYTVKAADNSTQNYTIVPKILDTEIDKLVDAFVKKHGVTGLTFAISNKEKLMYSKGYGIANKATNEAVTTNSLFRIASVSKPITGIAIMKLVENGKLKLDAKVFGDQGVLGTKYGTKPYRAGYENITVKQLLEHTSGLPTNDGNDPMFTEFNRTHDQIIDEVVKNRNLQATPGTKYSYSNFGYCVLGRIIEKVAGVSFEKYLQDEIMKPIGITKIQLTGNTIATRKENEVVYYNSTYNPYANNVARMDAHGGLIASSIDLVRLVAYVDGNSVKPDILKAETINTMTKFNPTTGYSLGWSVNQANHWWHTGSIIGTSAELVRTSSGYTWAIMANFGNVSNSSAYFSDLDNLGWQVVNAIKEWPEYDLF